MKEYKLKEKERRERRIYQAATRTLWQKGYERTTIRDIAKATDMTAAGLYYYFKSKEELLFQILNSHMDDMISGIERIPAASVPPLELIRSYVHYQVNSYCTDKYRTKLILNDDHCLTGAWYDRIKDKQRRYLGFWRRAIENYRRSEERPTDDVSIDAHCLVGMCVWIYRWYDPTGVIDPQSLAEKLFETFVFGLINKDRQS